MESIEYYVNKIHKYCNQIDEKCDDPGVISQLIEAAKCLKGFIEDNHSGIFMAVYDEGPEDNFVRVYRLLGRMTETEALELLKTFNSNGDYEHVVEISEIEWNMSYKLMALTDLAASLIKAENQGLTKTLKFHMDVNKEIQELRKQLGLRWDWEIVVNKNGECKA